MHGTHVLQVVQAGTVLAVQHVNCDYCGMA